MLLDEIGAILASSSVGIASSSGLGGYVLVKGQLPDSSQLPHQVVALIETQGLRPDAATELDQPGLQILVRGKPLQQASSAYSDARQKVQDARDALHAIAPGSYSGRHYAGIWAMQDPFLVHYDQNGRPVFSVNFLAGRSRT